MAEVKKKKRSKKSRKAKVIKARIISFVVAIVLILIVGIIAFAGKLKSLSLKSILAAIYPDKYAYSTEMADMNEVFNITGEGEVPIILQDELIELKAKLIDGIVYFPLDTVSSLFTRRFYYNETEKVLLYTTSNSVRKVDLDNKTKGYTVDGTLTGTDYIPARLEGDTVYVCADYVKLYCNYSYYYFQEPNRIQVYTSFKERNEAEVLEETAVRIQGGIKSPILTNLEKGDKVTVLETMETWSKVKTNNCFIGYIENDKLGDVVAVTDSAPTGAYVPREDYLSSPVQGTVVLGWHAIYMADDGSNLNSILPSGAGINVVSPTWFSIKDSSGNISSYANPQYVTNAHNKGYQVWALCDDFSDEIDRYELFSSSANRKNLIDNLISAVREAGADGINIDFEKVGKQAGPHYVQFLRELAIETRKNGLILSADNYPLNQGNLYYNLGEQGLVCDYVIIMNYDEHWAGSSEAGPVASIGFVENGLKSALDAGVPPYKLVNGVPFFSRLWKTEGDNLTSNALYMADAIEWAKNRNITPGFDETTCLYYVSHKDGTAQYEMWIEDKTSIEAKLSLCASYNIAGVAFWRLGYESADVWPVIANYYK